MSPKAVSRPSARGALVVSAIIGFAPIIIAVTKITVEPNESR